MNMEGSKILMLMTILSLTCTFILARRGHQKIDTRPEQALLYGLRTPIKTDQRKSSPGYCYFQKEDAPASCYWMETFIDEIKNETCVNVISRGSSIMAMGRHYCPNVPLFTRKKSAAEVVNGLMVAIDRTPYSGCFQADYILGGLWGVFQHRCPHTVTVRNIKCLKIFFLFPK